jgi:CHAT domain-containing protein
MIHKLRYRSLLCGCVFAISLSLWIQAQDQRQGQRLEPGTPIERELTGGQSHSYQLMLTDGQYIKVVVNQRDTDVAAKLFGPDAKQIAVVDNSIDPGGQETVLCVAKDSGNYRLDIVGKNASLGRYEIKVTESRTATDDDRALFEAFKLYLEFDQLYRADKYDEARPIGERVLEIRERVLGTEHIDVAGPLTDLAIINAAKGDYAKAEALFRRALAIKEKALGSNHLEVARSLTNLATLCNYKANYAEAVLLFERALPIFEKELGPQHPNYALALNSLADLYSQRGDYEKALSLYDRARAIFEKELGPQHPAFAMTLNNLALNYLYIGDYEKARPLYEQALSIQEKALGPEHPLVAGILNGLANIYRDSGDYAKAEQFYRRTLAILEKTVGPNHIKSCRGFSNLAALYRRSGEYAKAEPLYKRSLEIMENILGSDHPFTAELLDDYAMLYTAKGDIGQAITTLSRANTIDERNFVFNLDIGSERQKLVFLDVYRKSTNFTLSLQSEYAPNDPQALNLAFTTVLRRKARGLDAMADTIATIRRNATQQDRELFDKLTEARSQLATLALNDPGEAKPDTYRKNLDYLKERVDKLEADLSARNQEFNKHRKDSLPVSLFAVQASLPAHSALIEFAYFTPIDPKTEKSEPPRYLAYLLATQGQPNWVDLGEAAPIEQAIDAWRKALRNPNRADVKQLARALDELVMHPVREVLSDLQGNPTNLLISPDRSLNLIPFQALVDEQNQYLVEHYSITYLTSGRDLLRLQNSDLSRSEPLLIANPDFGRMATMAMRGGRTSAQIDPTRLYFSPLPATEDEALAIKAILPKASLLEQDDATETALKRATGPKILHIATHGFFLDYRGPSPAEPGQPPREASPGTNLLASTRAMPYTIQFEASPELETAQEKVKLLKSQGIDAYIVKTEVKGKGTFFRVRGGNFRTQIEAQKYGADLRGRGSVDDFFVARYEQPQFEAKNQVADLRLSRFATKIKDPLLRSGLALAGANQGKSGDDDGVLTALEAAYLDLTGTKLVVLSACDTGVGEVRNGEGVQGLRRALVLAGSESQVMSLWPVSDEATKDLMIPYYKALEDGKGRSEGLRQVQLRMVHGRRDRQHPFYWAAFIQSGEWANLDGQR